jgi:hypothetical protein
MNERKTERARPLVRQRKKWADKDRIDLAQDTDNFSFLMNTIMNLKII